MRSSASGHARLAFAGSMLVFGTIGLLRRFIDLPSAVIACFRGLLGCVLLLLLQRLRGRKPDLAALRRYLPALLISGGMIGFNWMLLFEAYRYTTIAVATLCYYMAPVLLIAFSPLLFKEKLTGRQIVCVLLAALGMVLVSGALDGSELDDGAMTGIALALGSAAGHTAVRRADAARLADAHGHPLRAVFRCHGAPAHADRRADELPRPHHGPAALRPRAARAPLPPPTSPAPPSSSAPPS